MTDVSGILRDTQDNALAGLTVTVQYKKAIVGYDGGGVVQNIRQFTTDGAGLLTMDGLVPGSYDLFVWVQENDTTTQTLKQKTTIVVLDQATQPLESAIVSTIGEITPSILQLAQEAAQDAANSAAEAEAFAAVSPRIIYVDDFTALTELDTSLLPAGQLAFMGDIGWKYVDGATDIPGAADWVVIGEAHAGHYGLSLTDDAANDTKLSGIVAGVDLNLDGASYPVTTAPTNIRAYNGAWIVGSDLVEVPSRKVSAFEPSSVVTVADNPHTFWNAGVWRDSASGWVYRAEVVSRTHDTTGGSRLDLVAYRDQGMTEAWRVTIFSSTNDPRVRSAAIGPMSSGRIGGVVTTGDTSRKQWFIYSDDIPSGSVNPGSITWNAAEITGLTVDHHVYGQLMAGPSGATGDWMVGTYAGTAEAKRLRTTDNGATWDETVLKGATGLSGQAPNPSEQSHVSVPGRGWAMFTRVEGDTTNTNLHVSLSADGLTYGDWQDTGVPLGGNPVHAIYDGGAVEVLLAYREGFADTPDNDAVEAIRMDADTLFDSPTNIWKLPRRSISTLPTKGIGYAESLKTERGWVHYIKAGESTSTVRGAVSKLIRMSQVAAPAPLVHPARQIIENNAFGLNRRGAATYGPVTADAPIVDRMRITPPASSNITATVADASEAVTDQLPWAMRAVTLSAAASGGGLKQVFLGSDAQMVAAKLSRAGVVTSRVYGVGAPPLMDLTVKVNGSTVSDAPGQTFPAVPSYVTGLWVATFRTSLDEITPEAIDATSAEIDLTTSGTWSSDALIGWSVWIGENPPWEGAQDMRPDNRYLWRGEAGVSIPARLTDGVRVSLTAFRFPLQGVEVLPGATVSVSDYAHVDVQTTGGGSFSVSALSLSQTQVGPPVLVSTNAATTDTDGVLTITNGPGDRYIQIDAEA